MPRLMAILIASLAGFAVHWIIGDHVSVVTDFILSTLVSGAAYYWSWAWLKQLRG